MARLSLTNDPTGEMRNELLARRGRRSGNSSSEVTAGSVSLKSGQRTGAGGSSRPANGSNSVTGGTNNRA